MSTTTGFSSRPGRAPDTHLKPARPRAVTRIALRALLVAGVGFTAIAQDFQNLDFESASVTPPGPAPVLFNSALPGWTGYCGANLQGMVNYNAEYLDSAGISLFDSNCTNEPVQGILHGRYCVCLYSGLLFGTYWGHAATSIAQTGRIPPDARSLLFNFSPSWHWGDQSMHVTFNQFTLPLHEVSAQSNFAVLGCDVSQFAGQIGELQFTAPTGPCECQGYR
ncbi:MAG: hypothetical protein NT154_32860, partial [Verrucomicrobia bacterium]|nr:hypothetical protein [Verrucomicrobiota bacterium]